MHEDSTNKVLSIKKNGTKNINNINKNLIISPPTQKNQIIKEKKLEIDSNFGTSDCSNKTKKNETKTEKEKEKYLDNINLIPTIDINNSNILLNKEQLYETFLLFQKFLSATQCINIDKNKDSNIINTNTNSYINTVSNTDINNDFISTLNNLKEVITNKENINNNIQNVQKEIKDFNLEKENQENALTSNFQQYNKNHINKISKHPKDNISFSKSNINDSKNNNLGNNISDKEFEKESSKKIFIKKSSNLFPVTKIKNLSQENIKEFNGINYSKVNTKNNNESFNKKNMSNDYSFDFSNNNIDSYSCSLGDSLQIMANDLFKTKIMKNNTDSIKLVQNYNKTSKSNDINKLNNLLDNNNMQSARQIRKNNYIESYNYKNQELAKESKKIKVIKKKDENSTKNIDLNLNEYSKNNKEQIIEEKIKELNKETIRFREEIEKVIKLKKEYEKLHEKLIQDIDNFNEKKEKFEKYRIEELNKIKEEKKNISSQTKLLSNIKIENQSLNISNKNDKETINNLKNYITQLKSIIKKKDEEIKILSQNNNNNNNNKSNYVINSYKSIQLFKEENCIKNKNIENKNKSFRNSILSKNNFEKCDKGYMTHLSCSKIKNKINYNEKSNSIINKSNSVINFNDCVNVNINVNEKKGRNYINTEENNVERKLNSFSGNILNSQLKINTSTNGKKQKIKLDMVPKKISDIRDKKAKNYHHKKISTTNINVKNKMSKNIEDKNNSKNLNNNTYDNIRYTQDFSKTSSNFMKKRKKSNKEDNKNYKDKILDSLKQKKRSLSNEKLELNSEYKEELNKPLNKEEYEFIIPEKYSKLNYKLIKKSVIDDKEVCIYSNNKKVIKFPSGLKKEIYNDGFQLVYFINGDKKQNYPDGKSKYFFKDANTVQTSYPNGIQVFKFYNGQIEKHFPNGLKKIFFPNGTIDYIFDNKKEGNNLNENKNIEKIEK